MWTSLSKSNLIQIRYVDLEMKHAEVWTHGHNISITRLLYAVRAKGKQKVRNLERQERT
jgi:hypothetical protein